MKRDALRLEWDQISLSGTTSLVVRHGDFPAASQAHTHDFAELFIVESGSAVHDRDRGEQPLEPGDVVFVVPETVHRFVTPTTDFTLTNVAFPISFLSLIREAIPEAERVWNDSTEEPIRLGTPQKVRVLRTTHDLARSNTRLNLVHLLVEILMSAQAATDPRKQPAWIHEALDTWQKDEAAVSQGVAGLATIAGRSREHVSRTLKTVTGQRAIDIVNNTRLELAASLLQTTDDGITTIAARVGFAGISHFYRLFKGRFGVTPAKFRQHRQAVVNPTDWRVPELDAHRHIMQFRAI